MIVYIKKLKYLLILFNLLFFSLTFAQNITNKSGIIPAPVSLKTHDGQFLLNNKTVIRTDSTKNKSVQFLHTYLSNHFHLSNKIISTSGKSSNVNSIIEITTKSNFNIPNEGYELKITPQKISLSGEGSGLFYGMQSLLQLLSDGTNGGFTVPCMEIKDYPRFRYRGLMLDVSRHFFDVNTVKQLIDIMAQYKLNTFHWHLTDNNGWRIEIKKYPKLTSVGGFAVNTVIDGDRDELDSVSTGGFYTQEQIKEVVRYATDRFITIVPEIEMPAHSVAALRAYPEFKCVLPENSKNLAANNIIFSPSEESFKFFEDVLNEVITLFPGKYIHIGGDEANKKPWEDSKFCQDLIKKLNLKDINELQSYFIQRMEKFLNAKGRNIIGWDEILEGGLAQNATVMSWRGEKGGIAAAKQKHNVVMTPGPNGMYFDHAQSNSSLEPFNHEPGYGGYATLLKTYNYGPIPVSLNQDEKQYIIGVQANIWTEHIATLNKLQYLTLPRIFALSEVAWTLPENKNARVFIEENVPKQLSIFEKQGYNFRVPQAFNATDTVMIGSNFIIQNKSTMPDSKTFYTLNGRTPTENDREYTKPLEFKIPKNERRELQTIVVSATGKRSVPTRTVMYNYDPLPSTNVFNLKAGLIYRAYQPDLLDTAQVHVLKASGILTDFHIDSLRKSIKNFKIICEGFLKVPTDNIYTFFLSAKNYNKLFIDGRSIIADNTNFSFFENTGAIPLQKGYHKFRLEYNTEGKVVEIPLYMQSTEDVKLRISPDLLFH